MTNTFTQLKLFDPLTRSFGHLDHKKWIKQNKIEEQAKRTGSNEFPPTENPELDQFPQEIKTWVNGEATDCRTEVTNSLEAIILGMQDQVNSVELKSVVEDCESKADKGDQKLNNVTAARKQFLKTHKDDLEESNRDLQDFKSQNKLTRVADFSHRSNTLLWVAAVAVAEIFLNASLLMQVTESGLLGSIFIMVLIASVNILVGFLVMGQLLRWLNHRKTAIKISVASVMILVLIGISFWNLLVGHYRDHLHEFKTATAEALQTPDNELLGEVLSNGTSDTLGFGALDRFKESPFGLDSFDTFLLVIVGMMCFAFTAFKGYQFDDPYPQYGKKTRLNKKIQDFILLENEQSIAELTVEYEKTEKVLQDQFSSITHKQHFYEEYLRSGKAIVKNYGINMSQYENVLQASLQCYYATNAEARSSPAPDWKPFNLEEKLFSTPEFSPPENVDLTTSLMKIKASIDKLSDGYKRACKEFLAEELS